MRFPFKRKSLPTRDKRGDRKVAKGTGGTFKRGHLPFLFEATVGCRAFFSKSAGTSRLTAHRMPAVTGGAGVKVDEQQVLISSVKTKIVKPEPDPRPHYPSRVTFELSALLFTTTRAPQSQK